jgi:hypothetical protein
MDEDCIGTQVTQRNVVLEQKKKKNDTEWHYLISLKFTNEQQNIVSIVGSNISIHILPLVLITRVFHKITQTDRMTCPLLVAASCTYKSPAAEVCN